MSSDSGQMEPFRVETNLKSKFSLCNNQWHSISALHDSKHMILKIDNESFDTLAHNGMTEIVDSSSPLYIGGLPGNYFIVLYRGNGDSIASTFGHSNSN